MCSDTFILLRECLLQLDRAMVKDEVLFVYLFAAVVVSEAPYLIADGLFDRIQIVGKPVDGIVGFAEGHLE